MYYQRIYTFHMGRSRCRGTKSIWPVFLAAIFLLYTSTSTLRWVVEFVEPQPTNDSPSSFLFSKDDVDFKPTTYLSEERCYYYSGQPPKKVASFEDYDHFRNLTELTTIRGEVDTPLAICRFNEHQQEVNHFPHVMQHLYMCYTFWQNNPSKIPVLYLKKPRGKEKMSRIFSQNPFLKGFVELLASQLNMRIFTHGEVMSWLETNMTRDNTNASHPSQLENESIDLGNDNKTNGKIYGINFTFHEMDKPVGYVLSHVESLNQMIQKHFDFKEREKQKSTTNTFVTPCPLPKIGILNRKASNGRSIENVESLVQRINSDFGAGNDADVSSSVVLTHFEGQSFQQQVQFFHDIDLLISPHGAQLIGIPFMANKPCAGMIELFPHNYLVPDYFGTLAVGSGIEYSYIYVSDRPATPGQNEAGRIAPGTSRNRGAARQQSICIDPDILIGALRDAIRYWCECIG